VVYSHAQSHAGLRSLAPENEEAAKDFSRAAPDRLGYSACSMRLEPFLRRWGSWAAARA